MKFDLLGVAWQNAALQQNELYGLEMFLQALFAALQQITFLAINGAACLRDLGRVVLAKKPGAATGFLV